MRGTNQRRLSSSSSQRRLINSNEQYDHVTEWAEHETAKSRQRAQIAFRGQIDVTNDRLLTYRAPIFFMLTLTG